MIQILKEENNKLIKFVYVAKSILGSSLVSVPFTSKRTGSLVFTVNWDKVGNLFVYYKGNGEVDAIWDSNLKALENANLDSFTDFCNKIKKAAE